MKISVLTRPGCHLCDEAIRDLRAWLAGERDGLDDLVVDLIDIESDDELHRRYLERIPVIRVDGEDVSEYVFDPEAFRSAVTHGSQGAG